MRKYIVIFYRAVFLDYWYWIVRYKDGKKTGLLSYSEAEAIRDIFEGKLYIDFSIKI